MSSWAGRLLKGVAAPRKRSALPAEVTERINGRPYRFAFQRTRSLVFDLWAGILQPQVLGALVLAISGLGAAFLARSLTDPIRQLQGRVRSIASGGMETRTGPQLTRRRDELGVLARDVDEMAGKIEALIAAREAMLRDVSHELRAPLARLRAAADLAREYGASETTFVRIDREIDRLDALIGQILKFSRLEAGPGLASARFDLSELLNGAVEDARLEAAAASKRVEFRSVDSTFVMGDARLLRSAVENVLRNAVRFSPTGEPILVDMRTGKDSVLVIVRDRGPGVSPDELPRMFEPFRGEGSGAGLGLAIARRVMQMHGGDIRAGNLKEGGLSVTLELPCTTWGAGPEA